MSWAEVKKINSDLSTPLDEKLSEIEKQYLAGNTIKTYQCRNGVNFSVSGAAKIHSVNGYLTSSTGTATFTVDKLLDNVKTNGSNTANFVICTMNELAYYGGSFFAIVCNYSSGKLAGINVGDQLSELPYTLAQFSNNSTIFGVSEPIVCETGFSIVGTNFDCGIVYELLE